MKDKNLEDVIAQRMTPDQIMKLSLASLIENKAVLVRSEDHKPLTNKQRAKRLKRRKMAKKSRKRNRRRK